MFCSGTTTGVGIAVKESICNNLSTPECVDEGLMSMRFDMWGQREAVNFVVAYAPTDGELSG